MKPLVRLRMVKKGIDYVLVIAQDLGDAFFLDLLHSEVDQRVLDEVLIVIKILDLLLENTSHSDLN